MCYKNEDHSRDEAKPTRHRWVVMGKLSAVGIMVAALFYVACNVGVPSIILFVFAGFIGGVVNAVLYPRAPARYIVVGAIAGFLYWGYIVAWIGWLNLANLAFSIAVGYCGTDFTWKLVEKQKEREGVIKK